MDPFLPDQLITPEMMKELTIISISPFLVSFPARTEDHKLTTVGQGAPYPRSQTSISSVTHFQADLDIDIGIGSLTSRPNTASPRH
jgi:hypothetical protein